jgi:hypothetical protein
MNFKVTIGRTVIIVIETIPTLLIQAKVFSPLS